MPANGRWDLIRRLKVNTSTAHGRNMRDYRQEFVSTAGWALNQEDFDWSAEGFLAT